MTNTFKIHDLPPLISDMGELARSLQAATGADPRSATRLTVLLDQCDGYLEKVEASSPLAHQLRAVMETSRTTLIALERGPHGQEYLLARAVWEYESGNPSYEETMKRYETTFNQKAEFSLAG